MLHDKENFLVTLSAAITLVGGCVSANRLRNMKLGELIDLISPNGIILKFKFDSKRLEQLLD